MSEVIRVEAADGTPTHHVAHAASELTQVRGRDVLIAWDAASGAALAARPGRRRIFRFRAGDGGWTELSLRDGDAQCWAQAVERTVGMRTAYGVAVCLRLLALVELMTRAPWLAATRGGGLSPRLARLAAEARLDDDARFDEAWFRARLAAPAPPIVEELAS